MAKEICAVCGESISGFKVVTLVVGKTSQTFCPGCAKEAQGMGEAELCRHVLSRSWAKNREKIQQRMDLVVAAEEARPKCLRCGTPIKFTGKVTLDASPMRDTLFSKTFDLIPAYCPNCFKMEFFAPEMIRQNELMALLYSQDT